jgi:hypothetical protein
MASHIKGRILRAYENRALLKGTVGPIRDDIISGWRRL